MDTPDKYPDTFSLLLNFEFKNVQSPSAAEEAWSNRSELENQLHNLQQHILFSSQEEMDTIKRVYGKFLNSK
jgi:hypothetical protein